MSTETFSPERLLEAMNGMSNIDLAERLGCSRSNITMYLNGSRTPTKMTIQLMAISLNVSPAWLMGLDVEKYVKSPPPSYEDGLDAEKLAFIEKLKGMDSDTVSALNKLADSIIAKRDK